MDEELSGSGAGLSALLLSMGILFTLVEKKTFSSQEALDVVDLSLMNLAMRDRERIVPETPEVQSARDILQAIKMQLRAN
nr:hypothetical protein DBT53_10365 [Aerococcus mictus]